ncbi:MAG: NifB/NifX family molybdenum-iron cluster-binding protein [Thermosipho sp. (in: Bacteria)]|nr:NifB/NifX family molybdenum-iron cluster-binding protein [Thermosipho sp. (in: thermotogales)]
MKNNLKILIPTDDGNLIATHFGRSKYFLIVEIKNGKVETKELIENFHAKTHHGTHEEHHGNDEHSHKGHEHDELFTILGDIEAIIAVRVGPKLYEDLMKRNIDLYFETPNKSLDQIIEDFLEGKLEKFISRN